jgi:benzoyl-CoA-dihydrodiol lyase
VVPGSKFDDAIEARAKEFAAQSGRAAAGAGIKLTPLSRKFSEDGIE